MGRGARQAEAGCGRGKRRRLEARHCRHMGARCEPSGRLGLTERVRRGVRWRGAVESARQKVWGRERRAVGIGRTCSLWFEALGSSGIISLGFLHSEEKCSSVGKGGRQCLNCLCTDARERL